MGIKPPTCCKRCFKAAESGSICNSCRKTEPITAKGYRKYDATEYSADPITQMYRTARWVRFEAVIKSHNPICQRLVDGQQCNRASKIVHHLVSPRVNPSLFLTPGNVVAVCRDHHPQTAGDAGYEYVETKWLTFHF